MNLKNLAKPMDYKWRVQSFSKNKASASCVAYVDARQVQDRLDEVCGSENWQNDYYIVGGLLFCKIGIKIGDEWVWKGDTGSESNIEKEKGHVSDAFKRAAVHWSIGRFLYEMEIKYVTANEKKTQSNYPYVVDSSGKRVWNLTKHIRNINKSPPPANTPRPTDQTADQASRLIKLMDSDGSVNDLNKRYKSNVALIKSFSADLNKKVMDAFAARKKAILEKKTTTPPIPEPDPVNDQPPPQNKEEMPPPGEEDLPPDFDGEPTAREKTVIAAKEMLDGAGENHREIFWNEFKKSKQFEGMPLDDQSEIRKYYESS